MQKEQSFIPPRLELFSDAVFAIIITIMVLELRPPTGHYFADLLAVFPIFLSYVLSFMYLLIYWNNHHHLLRAMRTPTPGIMWANAHLLFWLSLIPFATAWLGESHGAFAPVLLYGFMLLAAAFAYSILQAHIVAQHEEDSQVTRDFKFENDFKGKASIALYVLAIGAAFVSPIISYIIFALVAVMWLVPRHLVR